MILVFSLSALWWRRIRGLWKLPDGRDWLRGIQGLVLMGGAVLSKSLIQFSVYGWSWVSSLLFTWGQTMVEVMKIMVTSLKRSHAVAAMSLQSCSTLCSPIDGSLPGSPFPGILQARTLEWVAISFSNAWKWKWSRVWLLAFPWNAAYQAPLSMGFSRQEYWSGLPLPSPQKIPYMILKFSEDY